MILVTGGCGFLGSHVVDELASRGRDVLVLDDLSTAELRMDVLTEDRDTPRWVNDAARYRFTLGDLNVADLREVHAVLHLALRHPLERERSTWVTAFEGYVVGGVRLLMRLLDLRAPVSRFVLAGPTHRMEPRGMEADLVRALRDLLADWHRPPALGIYCAWLPEQFGERRLTDFPGSPAVSTSIPPAVRVLADLTDGSIPHRLNVDVHPDVWEDRGEG